MPAAVVANNSTFGQSSLADIRNHTLCHSRERYGTYSLNWVVLMLFRLTEHDTGSGGV